MNRIYKFHNPEGLCFVTLTINDWLLKQFQTDKGNNFWQPESRPIELWSNKVIDQKLNYIHYNPVEEGMVFRPEDYMYSSSNDYAGGMSLLDIVVIG